MEFFPVMSPRAAMKADLGTRHLVQAHLLEEYPDSQELYAEWCTSETHWVILDCGTWELKYPDIDALLRVGAHLGPDEIVVPDVFGSREGTIDLMKEHAHACLSLTSSGGILVVPHGNDIYDWMECVAEMKDWLSGALWERTCLAIPKVVGCPEYRGGRDAALSYLTYTDSVPGHGVHLLGEWYDFWNPISLGRNYPCVRSVDTTFPYAYAMDGRMMTIQGSLPKVEFKPEWWHATPDPDQVLRIMTNIGTCERMCAREW